MIIEVEDESGSVRNGSLTMDAERIRLHSKAAGSILIRNLFFCPGYLQGIYTSSGILQLYLGL
jgi:hypothetical protein